MKLNLGCGRGVIDGYVNVDRVKFPGVDIVHDLDQAPWPVADAVVEEIQAWHVFEHVRDPCLFMCEAWRVLREGGKLVVVTPVWTHPTSFTDPTHLRHCTPETWDYWVPGTVYYEPDAYGVAPYVKEGWQIDKEQSSIRVVLRKILDVAGPGSLQPESPGASP
jgi:ubiquinone/menaquinone biosynthesis C-methylase UbiE